MEPVGSVRGPVHLSSDLWVCLPGGRPAHGPFRAEETDRHRRCCGRTGVHDSGTRHRSVADLRPVLLSGPGVFRMRPDSHQYGPGQLVSPETGDGHGDRHDGHFPGGLDHHPPGRDDPGTFRVAVHLSVSRTADLGTCAAPGAFCHERQAGTDGPASRRENPGIGFSGRLRKTTRPGFERNTRLQLDPDPGRTVPSFLDDRSVLPHHPHRLLFRFDP